MSRYVRTLFARNASCHDNTYLVHVMPVAMTTHTWYIQEGALACHAITVLALREEVLHVGQDAGCQAVRPLDVVEHIHELDRVGEDDRDLLPALLVRQLVFALCRSHGVRSKVKMKDC